MKEQLYWKKSHENYEEHLILASVNESLIDLRGRYPCSLADLHNFDSIHCATMQAPAIRQPRNPYRGRFLVAGLCVWCNACSF